MAHVDRNSFQIIAYNLPGNNLRNIQQTLDLAFNSQTTLHSRNDEEVHLAANPPSAHLLVIMHGDISDAEEDNDNSKMVFSWAALSVNKPAGNKTQFTQWCQLMSMTQLSDLHIQLAHINNYCGMRGMPTPVTLDWDWEVYAAALKRKCDGGKPRYEDSDVIAHFEGAVLPRMLRMILRDD
ncbi:hypothetical protein KC318_g19366 [Hortaea werneckii]|uniref:Uncharacterized protein n=1 Tax=Hortaea werneckii TaxID=91943 RepID=A0A3M6X8N4_HORWE|nr:hypothetical protein KC334_g18598 [Hortaea werneckii]KAI6910165.1 hypothetical protein KC355_g18412 [Hortaea werneckii]KAI7646386.1 hypothetical protein KC318_g19366 [Hortaea werneckii]RMX87019.1 hypothetical protein D0867_15705 [Hortaea werneckii]RMY31742.1 hypothetical protein D0866_07091 [Hortaea werneckii]